MNSIHSSFKEPQACERLSIAISPIPLVLELSGYKYQSGGGLRRVGTRLEAKDEQHSDCW